MSGSMAADREDVLEAIPVPVLSDNYVWVIRRPGFPQVAVVDPPEASPVIAWLESQDAHLSLILNTHHHWDHTGGIAELKARFGAPVAGPARETETSALIGRPCREGDELAFADARVRVLEVPGHTLDHVAFHFPDDDLVACGDTLFSLGCGRIFEGTPEMMWHSLDRLRRLPGSTRVCCAHEYTLANGRFALHVEPGNRALQRRMREVEDLRTRSLPTLPSTIALERATNPFLRPESAEIRARLDLAEASDVAVFAALRRMKDRFRG